MKKKMTPRQQQIIDQALLLIDKGGIQNLTIKNLAKSLKVTEPAIYRHFNSKSEILIALINSFSFVANQVLDEAGEDENRAGLAGIEFFVKNRLEVVENNPPLAKVIFAEDIFMDKNDVTDFMFDMIRTHKERLREMILEAQCRGEIKNNIAPDIIFRLIMGPVRMLIKQWGFSNYSFNIKEEGYELWEALAQTLKP